MGETIILLYNNNYLFSKTKREFNEKNSSTFNFVLFSGHKYYSTFFKRQIF